MFAILVVLLALTSKPAQAQTPPILTNTYSVAVPSDANILMDCSETHTVSAYSNEFGGMIMSIDSLFQGVTAADPEDVEWVEPVNVMVNQGEISYVLSSNASAHTTTIRAYDNNTLSFTYQQIDWTFTYNNPEVLDMHVKSTGTADEITILAKVFDTNINKWKGVVYSNTYDYATGFSGWIEIIASITVAEKNTVPTSMEVSPSGNIYIWGYFDRNVAGTNHDMFLSRYNAAGSLLFNKTFASYTGRDDIAFDLISDASGNLYGISSSQDNVAPYSNHIAVLKINPNNGKTIWLKRIGTGTAGSEAVYSVSGNTLGSGLVIGGSSNDGGGGRNGQIWCMSTTGSILWNRVINSEAPGAIEECRAVIYHPVNGNVYSGTVTGGILKLYSNNPSSGLNIWSPVTIDGDGTTISDKVNIDFQLNGGTIIISSVAQVGLGRQLQLTEIEEIAKSGDIANIGIGTDLLCFPNPASTRLQLTGISGAGSIQIYSLNGQLMREQSVNEGEQTIDVSDLNAGLYQLIYLGNNETKQVSFVVTK